jgi:hypothetical protein
LSSLDLLADPTRGPPTITYVGFILSEINPTLFVMIVIAFEARWLFILGPMLDALLIERVGEFTRSKTRRGEINVEEGFTQ